MPERLFDAQEFRAARRAADVTQAQAGEAAGGVLESAVSKWETGRTAPSPEMLPKLAKLVGKPIDELFPREGLPDLTDLRCDAGYTPNDTAAIIGTSTASPVRKAEGGVRRLSEQFKQPLADAYGVSVKELEAAQERSFGHAVPDVRRVTAVPDAATRADVPSTLADKITYVLNKTYAEAHPSDEELAREGNKKFGHLVLTSGRVTELRENAAASASEDELDALAAALDVPAKFFMTDDPDVARVVDRSLTTSHRLRVMAARGGENGLGDKLDELFDFVDAKLNEILGED